MARGGAKKFPFYQVQVADRRSPRDGRYIERIGHYNPRLPAEQGGLSLDLKRADHWLGQGAVASERVRKLIKVQRRLDAEAAQAAATEADSTAAKTAQDTSTSGAAGKAQGTPAASGAAGKAQDASASAGSDTAATGAASGAAQAKQGAPASDSASEAAQGTSAGSGAAETASPADKAS